MCKICSELTIKHRNDIDDVVLMFLLLALLLTDFTHCSLVSIVNFEQINASWSNALGILHFIYGSCLRQCKFIMDKSVLGRSSCSQMFIKIDGMNFER